METVQQVKSEQYKHVVAMGGYLELPESDATNNDLNRRVIAAYRANHGHAFMGNINFYDDVRAEIVSGTRSVYEEYVGQPVYNFHCTFVVPVEDEELTTLIRAWNKDGVEYQNIDTIFDRIDALGGEHFIWS